MKKIIIFHAYACPYCEQAKRACQELMADNPLYAQVVPEWINEEEHPEIAQQYDYYYVPSAFVDGEKVYEAYPGETYEHCQDMMRKVFQKAVQKQQIP